jgi:hypothetical protein
MQATACQTAHTQWYSVLLPYLVRQPVLVRNTAPPLNGYRLESRRV